MAAGGGWLLLGAMCLLRLGTQVASVHWQMELPKSG